MMSTLPTSGLARKLRCNVSLWQSRFLKTKMGKQYGFQSWEHPCQFKNPTVWWLKISFNRIPSLTAVKSSHIYNHRPTLMAPVSEVRHGGGWSPKMMGYSQRVILIEGIERVAFRMLGIKDFFFLRDYLRRRKSVFSQSWLAWQDQVSSK